MLEFSLTHWTSNLKHRTQIKEYIHERNKKKKNNFRLLLFKKLCNFLTDSVANNVLSTLEKSFPNIEHNPTGIGRKNETDYHL